MKCHDLPHIRAQMIIGIPYDKRKQQALACELKMNI